MKGGNGSILYQLIQSSVGINRPTGKLSKNKMENQKKNAPNAIYWVWINFPTGLFVPPRPVHCVVNFRTGYIPHGKSPNCFSPHSKTMKRALFCKISRFLRRFKTLGKYKYMQMTFVHILGSIFDECKTILCSKECSVICIMNHNLWCNLMMVMYIMMVMLWCNLSYDVATTYFLILYRIFYIDRNLVSVYADAQS